MRDCASHRLIDATNTTYRVFVTVLRPKVQDAGNGPHRARGAVDDGKELFRRVGGSK
jgi:hypothetical protein